ncbi:hypothetical protein [Streptomyces sp. NPDC050485]|uniref:hypothetical protein n=1 Tax=Streptomyces sp. NPDC050485 TaxID=3365617 RepID=UPI00379E3C55
MSVTLAKTPRAFTVLMQDGAIKGTLLTPATEEGYDELAMTIGYGSCLDIFEVTAIDRYEAHTRAMRLHDRATAIEVYMDRVGVSYGTARRVYLNNRTWVRTLTPEDRASWLAHDLKQYAPLLHIALIEAVRDFGEPTTA